ncbi:MAG: Solitary outer membrane autotransporter beta-barrel domain [Verrucomicrobia bacterium]|nr:Solitary outer membrane autotransporter beta-barrel domain [Verrucomicrobiota bacterium]
MKNTHSSLSHRWAATVQALGLAATLLAPVAVQSQALDEFKSQFNNVVGSRVETLTILGGDYGFSGGTFTSFRNPDGKSDISIDKFGGYGDIGDPEPIGNTGIGFQPRLQGEMGYIEAKKVYTSGDLQGDVTKYKTFAIQFGGGGRFWFNDHLSLAPTFMGMYGHSENEYTAHSDFAKAIFDQAQQFGLINWKADTWTVRPAANLQYVYTWHRTIFTLSSDYTYFHTESFHTSTSNLKINGDSETWKNQIDVDIPLGKQLLGHELRTGGYFNRQELYGGIKSGMGTDHLYEIHPRLVLDFLGELWKVQWIGFGGSYMWGGPLSGWSFGADVAFRF